MVSRRLGLPNRLEEFWNPMFGSSYSCNDYFESYLLPAAESPLLLVLDEVNVVLTIQKSPLTFLECYEPGMSDRDTAPLAANYGRNFASSLFILPMYSCR
jgi:hypothetical protein